MYYDSQLTYYFVCLIRSQNVGTKMFMYYVTINPEYTRIIYCVIRIDFKGIKCTNLFIVVTFKVLSSHFHFVVYNGHVHMHLCKQRYVTCGNSK